jgi:prophage regulatory protein
LIYRKKALLQLCGISETTLRRWMETEGFPRPRQLGPRAVGWVSIQVDAWLVNRPVAHANGDGDDDETSAR